MPSLYHLYRPKNFSEVLTQTITTDLLKAQIISGDIGNAYLFCGQHGVGKTSVARIFAKAINCEQFKKNNDVCNACSYCQHFDSVNLSDFVEIDGASNRGIDEIRAITEQLRYPPSFLKYKIYIIDEAHMITGPAFNAFLKTLEEPPPYVIFILATTEAHKLPKTILSRVQIFDFKKASRAEIEQKLGNILTKEKISADKATLEYLSMLGKGSFRDAESVLTKIIASRPKKVTLEFLKTVAGITDFHQMFEYVTHLIKHDEKSALTILNDHIVANTKDLKIFTEHFLLFLRNILIAQYGEDMLSSRDYTAEERAIFTTLAKQIPAKTLIALIEIFRTAYTNLYYYPIQTIPLEIATIEAIEKLKA